MFSCNLNNNTKHAPFILGINPWIYDFAAFNLWSRPVGLLACLSMLRDAGAMIGLVDCMHQAAGVHWPKVRTNGLSHYPKTPVPMHSALKDFPRQMSRYGLPVEVVAKRLKEISRVPDAVFVTCIMTYWYPGAFAAINLVKKIWPRVPVVLGGTYASLCYEHAREKSGADLVIAGPLERPDNWAEVFALLGDSAPELPDQAGFDLALDLYRDPKFVPVLGSRGCPFSCSYCASKSLYPRFRQRPWQSVLEGIEFQYRLGVRDFAFYDDALLINFDKWLGPILEGIIAKGFDLRLHTPNAVHIRHLTPQVCALLKRAGLSTLRLGLETTDFDHRQDVKLTREQWDQGVKNLERADFRAGSIGAYILFGLPDQDQGLVEKAVDMVKSHNIRPHLAQYTPIPHTALFEQAQKTSPYPIADEPLFQNNSIWPCYPGGFSWSEHRRWKNITA